MSQNNLSVFQCLETIDWSCRVSKREIMFACLNISCAPSIPRYKQSTRAPKRAMVLLPCLETNEFPSSCSQRCLSRLISSVTRWWSVSIHIRGTNIITSVLQNLLGCVVNVEVYTKLSTNVVV